MPEVRVAHDVVCPWCWCAWEQAKRLRAEFPAITLRWLGYELLPEGLAYNRAPKDPNEVKKPRIPTRLELLLLADGLILPKREHGPFNSRLALEGAEFAYEAGRADQYLDALYHAYWEEDRDISDRAVLGAIARSAACDEAEFMSALDRQRFKDRVVEFDEPAHEKGIWHVPTWMFPEEWVAEQPYSVVRELAASFVAHRPTGDPVP